MNAAELIREIQKVGGKLSVAGDKLHYRFPHGDSERFLEQLAAHKQELLVILKAQRGRTAPAPQLEGLAECGNPSCNGCYDVGDGRRIHPPRIGKAYLDWLAQWEPQGKIQ